MSSPPAPDAAAWRREAEAVIADIAPHVAAAALASLPVAATAVYLNLETVEGRQVTLRMSAAGFCLCGEGYDTDSDEEGAAKLFETPYALLHSISEGYTLSFGNALIEKLGQLGDDSDGGKVDEEGVR